MVLQVPSTSLSTAALCEAAAEQFENCHHSIDTVACIEIFALLNLLTQDLILSHPNNLILTHACSTATTLPSKMFFVVSLVIVLLLFHALFAV